MINRADLILELPLNEAGQDWVVGDIHGCFDKLQEILDALNFNPATDRLFSVGDMVDRGPTSYKCLEWLNKPWFYAVTGNHEQLAIEHHAGTMDVRLYEMNGGGWFIAMDEEQQGDYVRAFQRLPLGIEVDLGDGKAGIVHAEVPSADWAEFKRLCASRRITDHMEHYALWGRSIIRNHRLGAVTENFRGVDNIDVVYVGHSVVPDVTELGNIRYVDTGCAFGKKLTVMNMMTGKVYSVENKFADEDPLA